MRRTTAILSTIAALASWLLAFQPAHAVTSWSGTIQQASFICSTTYDRDPFVLCPLDPTRPTNNLFTSSREIPAANRNGHTLVRITLPATFTQADGSLGQIALTFGNPLNVAGPFSARVVTLSSGNKTICVPTGMTSFYVSPHEYRGYKPNLAWKLEVAGTC